MDDLITIGWREWCSLPDLGLPAIKAKIDTGAKTSALHTFHVERFQRNQRDFVKFGMHPLQHSTDLEIECEAPLLDERLVSDSGGHKENRYVIQTRLALGDYEWPIELTLTNRDSMRFRMLLGRRAMVNRILVDPSTSYLMGQQEESQAYNLNQASQRT